MLIAVSAEQVAALRRRAETHGLEIARLGLTGGDALVVERQFDVTLTELGAAHAGTLPAVFGH